MKGHWEVVWNWKRLVWREHLEPKSWGLEAAGHFLCLEHIWSFLSRCLLISRLSTVKWDFLHRRDRKHPEQPRCWCAWFKRNFVIFPGNHNNQPRDIGQWSCVHSSSMTHSLGAALWLTSSTPFRPLFLFCQLYILSLVKMEGGCCDYSSPPTRKACTA